MKLYEKFINPRYVKTFNHFLQKVCEPKIKQKYNRDVKLTLYGISIRPKNSIYNLIPKDELTQSQGNVNFFIDSNPSKLTPHNFVEGLILGDGRTFLNLQDATYYGGGFDKFLVGVHFDKRPLYPLDYVVEDPITENKLPFIQKEKNGIKTRLFKEGIESEELKWHFNQRDRKVKVMQSNNWMLQLDNEIPKQLKEGQIVSIPKGVHHRVIKGEGDLIVKIKEL